MCLTQLITWRKQNKHNNLCCRIRNYHPRKSLCYHSALLPLTSCSDILYSRIYNSLLLFFFTWVGSIPNFPFLVIAILHPGFGSVHIFKSHLWKCQFYCPEWFNIPGSTLHISFLIFPHGEPMLKGLTFSLWAFCCTPGRQKRKIKCVYFQPAANTHIHKHSFFWCFMIV